MFVDDSIVRGTQLKETIDFLYKNGAKGVHMRSACPPIMYGCKYLNFSRATDDLELIARRIIMELEGEEGFKYIDEYSDSKTERGKKLRKTICEKEGIEMIHILVVEDDASLNQIVCTYLNDSGFQAKGCLSANAAYEEMYNHLYELIISDIMMPEIDGFEFAQTVRQVNKTIPIYVGKG